MISQIAVLADLWMMLGMKHLHLILATGALALLLAPSWALAFNPDDLAKLEATGSCEGCDLSGAKLRVGRLAGANLRGADLSGADLISADLGDADLSQARLSGANLIRASLQRARLDGSDLTDAVLIRLHLEGTDLSGATGLTQEQLGRACADDATVAPPGLTARACIAGEG